MLKYKYLWNIFLKESNKIDCVIFKSYKVVKFKMLLRNSHTTKIIESGDMKLQFTLFK